MARPIRTPVAAGLLVLVLAPPLGAQSLPPPLQPLPATTTSQVLSVAQTGDRVVEITRQVPLGDTGTAVFTVPSGAALVVTDVLLTNPGTVAVCGVSIDRAAAPTVLGGTVTGVQAPVTVTDSTLTGPLCVAPRTTQQLILTSGMDFAAGQTVQVANRPEAGLAPEAAGAPVSVHLRGFLTSVSATTTAPNTTTPPGTTQ